MRRFQFIARDIKRVEVDTSGSSGDRLAEAERIARNYWRGYRGCAVVIVDSFTLKKYSLTESGKAIEIPDPGIRQSPKV